MSLLPTYEVYALRYATVDRKRRENFIATPIRTKAPCPWITTSG